ncbi:MAG: DNA mismatch repair protein MutS [Clostridiales bacterium]|nr:DNA mismatch repair protein MutS [Clostridiales bacterium]
MMQQYLDIKEKYKEYILMYCIGDFYEMFFDDAKVASGVLDLVLTGRDNGDDDRAPMCGVPFHAADNYIGRLVAKGYKVAVCEQMEDPALAKGLVKREVIRMITPGTVTETNFLDEKKNNYFCAVCLDGDSVGVAFADISTGDVSATEFSGENKLEKLMGELGSHSPREAVLSCKTSELLSAGEFLSSRIDCLINENEPERFDGEKAYIEAKNRLSSIPPEFENGQSPALRAFGAIISYATETQKNDLSNINAVNFYKNGEYLEIDVNSRRNLELCETMRRAEKKGTLLWVLDKTKTAAGARMLRRYLDFPLCNPAAINRRQAAVAEMYDNLSLRFELGEMLSGVLDLERLITKIVYASATAKDMRAIAQTAHKLPKIKALALSCHSDELRFIGENLDELDDICALIDSAIVDDPPFSVREGGFIRDGYSADVDYLRSIMTNSHEWISKIEETEKNETGIRTLKVGYNRVFGYYIEVSKSFINDVPDRFIRKQTLANAERYITEELKDLESQILGASEKLVALEYQLFTEIRNKISECVHRIQSTASLLAKLDVYRSLADVASQNGYVRPEVTYGDEISITDGRHPVVEQCSKDTFFVPNDTELDCKNNRFMLITGPNMAGKSTYMRQVALICVMAQIGSFVPARDAKISVVDKIFTRVGASDDLSMGQSTFMLEMSEVAYILSNATRRSLIIYDEIGRGTSTFDGMSIARAVAEYTAGKKIGAKTLFATHYHELTSLEDEIDGVVNYNIAAKKKGDSITFLRKIVRGSADDSYGIEVAKLAGVPAEVTKRAKEILSAIENGNAVSTPKKARHEEYDDGALTFDNFEEKEVCDKLRASDINTLTPLEAINLIFELKKILH